MELHHLAPHLIRRFSFLTALDAMDKLKALFKRKKDKTASSTAGTKTEAPAAASVPKPAEPAAPSTADPAAAPAGEFSLKGV